jgi:hypothetical protein
MINLILEKTKFMAFQQFQAKIFWALKFNNYEL